ncbi:hypothetical protein H0H92_008086 [Tricholoma furcatifolium]|nr:hypothetical protein H0H92_008086 [Tricholoma furcatifolium]
MLFQCNTTMVVLGIQVRPYNGLKGGKQDVRDIRGEIQDVEAQLTSLGQQKAMIDSQVKPALPATSSFMVTSAENAGDDAVIEEAASGSDATVIFPPPGLPPRQAPTNQSFPMEEDEFEVEGILAENKRSACMQMLRPR